MAIDPYIDTIFCDLAEPDTQKILAHLAQRWRLGACRNCDGTFYQLLAQVTLRFSDDPAVIVDSSGHERPCAALVCTTCGEVRTIDLTVVGVFERKPPAPRTPPRDAGPTSGPYR